MNNSADADEEDNDKTFKKPSRRKRGYQLKEAEFSALNSDNESNKITEIKDKKTESDNLSV